MNEMDQKMRGPRPTEGRVNRSYMSDGAPSYGRLGYPDVTPSYDNSYSKGEGSASVSAPFEVFVQCVSILV